MVLSKQYIKLHRFTDSPHYHRMALEQMQSIINQLAIPVCEQMDSDGEVLLTKLNEALQKVKEENERLKQEKVTLSQQIYNVLSYWTGNWKNYRCVEQAYRDHFTEEYIQGSMDDLNKQGLFEDH